MRIQIIGKLLFGHVQDPSFFPSRLTNSPSQTHINSTVCFTDLDLGSEMIIFESNLTTFTARFVFKGRWGGRKNWLKLEIRPPLANLACPNQWTTLYLTRTYTNTHSYNRTLTLTTTHIHTCVFVFFPLLLHLRVSPLFLPAVIRYQKVLMTHGVTEKSFTYGFTSQIGFPNKQAFLSFQLIPFQSSYFSKRIEEGPN